MNGKIFTGFGKASLKPAFNDGKRFVDNMDVRGFACKGDACTALILVSDLGCPAQATILKIRKEVSKAVKLPVDYITLNTTQNHTTERLENLNYRKAANAYIQAAKNGLKDLKPVKYTFVSLEPKPLIHFNRRPKVKGLGAFTTWFGIRNRNGKADVGHIAKLFAESIRKGNLGQVRSYAVGKDNKYPKAAPLYLKKAEDNLLQAVFFKDYNGKPAGSLIRLAAHPVTANIYGCDYHSHDYPGYAREYLEKKFGGQSVFLLGPCGNQVPFLGRKSLQFAKKYGYNVGKLAFDRLKNAEWKCCGEVKAATEDAFLTVRRDLPKSIAECGKVKTRLKSKFAQMHTTAPLVVLKKLTDRIELIEAIEKKWRGRNIVKLRGKKIRAPVFALKMGDLGFVSLTSEAFGAYSVAIRKNTLGDKMITFEEGNGYLGYLPTDKERKYGNYEVTNCCMEKGVEKQLVGAGLKAAKKAGI